MTQRRIRRSIAWISAVLLGLPLLLAAFFAWVVSTEAGLRFATGAVDRALGARLEIEASRGRLAGPLGFRKLVYADADRRIEVENLELEWSPRQLWESSLWIQRLAIGRLAIATRKKETKTPPPESLRLPVALRLEQLDVERMEIGTLGAAPAAPGLVLEGLKASAASDGQHHRLESLHFVTSRLAIDAQASVDGDAPFAASGTVNVKGEEQGHPFTVAIAASGALRDLDLKAQSGSGTLKVDAQARLDAFADMPLKQLDATASGLDPAAWAAAAPRAQLNLVARLAPVDGKLDEIAGEVRAENRNPGRVDEKRIPLRSLSSQIHWQGGRLTLSDFVATLTGGRIAGAAQLLDGQLTIDSRIAQLDASKLHRSLQPTRLSGPLSATVSTERQQVRTSLADPRFRLEVDAMRDKEAIRIETARIDAKGAELQATGRIDPSGAYAFQGRLRDFNPALFVNVPTAKLNATLDAKGVMAKQPTLALRFELGPSMVAKHPFAGRGEVALEQERLQRVDVNLSAGDNRLSAKGRLGAPSDTLTLSVDAPRLEQMGFAGELRAEVILSGALRTPAADWKIDSPRLALPNGTNLRSLASRGRMEAGMRSVRAELTLASFATGGATPLAADVSLRLDGQRAAHTLTGTATLQEKNRVDFAARGGLDPNNAWSGSIERLELQGPRSARLTSPAPIRVAADNVLLERASIAGDAGNMVIEHLAWQPGRIQSRGRATGFKVAAFMPNDQALSTTLTLGGEWNVDLGERAIGTARIRRESGDLVLKADQPLALGLERLLLSLDFTGRGAHMAVDASGTQAGTIKGTLGLQLAQNEGQWSVDRRAPWRGNVEIAIPSLAWLSTALGSNVALGGNMHGAVRIAGTPAAPTTSGQLAGDGLRVRLRDQGVELGGGVMRVEFDNEVARLRRIEFASVASQAPRDRRVPYNQLTARPGRLTAEGEIGLRNGSGRIALRADNLAVSQLPDRWIMVSGTGSVGFDERRLGVAGQLKMDGGYVELEPPGMPKLSDDVVVVGRKTDTRPRPKVDLDVQVNLGDAFYFYGKGIDTRLAGQLHLLAKGGGALRATGSVRTVGGTVDAYGRELAIERGILNFQGGIDNPGLNVRAMRKNLQVEAGVEVTGSLKNPIVRLVSEPPVSDTEKLSWLVLGRAPDQSFSAKDADLLLSAAAALRGNQGGGGGLRSIQQGLGLEELGVSSGNLRGLGSTNTSRVVGASGFGSSSGTTAEQIATVGKRIGSNAVLSYERSLTTAESILKLTVTLSRRLSLVGRVGADNAVDMFYTFSFGK